MPMRLRRVDPSADGFSRVRHGSGFSYLDLRGQRITDRSTVQRIDDLAIPPAWTDVWICADERGHLQATGTDDAGRRQYLYHEAWRARREVEKFRRLEAFADALPAVRRHVRRDLARRDMPKERALAVSIRLLDQGFFRIGTEGYAERNGSFGLATIRKSHVQIRGSIATFDYTAKSGVRRVQRVDDGEVMPALRMMKERDRGGRELLAFLDGDRWHDLRSGEINEYLKSLAGEEHSAKDFRTWHATVLAAVEIAGIDPSEVTSIRRSVTATVNTVAEHLGNTPAVARTSYIDPRVFERFAEGQTVSPRWADARSIGTRAQGRIEREVLDLLRGGRVTSKAA